MLVEGLGVNKPKRRAKQVSGGTRGKKTGRRSTNDGVLFIKQQKIDAGYSLPFELG